MSFPKIIFDSLSVRTVCPNSVAPVSQLKKKNSYSPDYQNDGDLSLEKNYFPALSKYLFRGLKDPWNIRNNLSSISNTHWISIEWNWSMSFFKSRIPESIHQLHCAQLNANLLLLLLNGWNFDKGEFLLSIIRQAIVSCLAGKNITVFPNYLDTLIFQR